MSNLFEQQIRDLQKGQSENNWIFGMLRLPIFMLPQMLLKEDENPGL